jgi:hypothetical protein
MRLILGTSPAFIMGMALAFPLAACQLPGQGETGAGGAGGSSASGGEGHTQTACEKASANCNECFTCAAQGKCAELAQACQNDPGCSTLDQCVSVCEGDADCEQSCAMSASEGIDLYERALGCVYCVECAEMCAGRGVCR